MLTEQPLKKQFLVFGGEPRTGSLPRMAVLTSSPVSGGQLPGHQSDSKAPSSRAHTAATPDSCSRQALSVVTVVTESSSFHFW